MTLFVSNVAIHDTRCKFFHWLSFEMSMENGVKVKRKSYNWSSKSVIVSLERPLLWHRVFGRAQVIQGWLRTMIKVLLWNIRVRWVQKISSTSPSSALICSGRCACYEYSRRQWCKSKTIVLLTTGTILGSVSDFCAQFFTERLRFYDFRWFPVRSERSSFVSQHKLDSMRIFVCLWESN